MDSGGSRLAASLANELEAGRSIVALVPSTVVGEELSSAISRSLGLRGKDCYRLDAAMSRELGLLEAVATRLGLKWRSPGREAVQFEGLVRSATGIPHVFIIEGLAEVGEIVLEEWLRTLDEWSRVARFRPNGEPPRPLFFVPVRANCAHGVFSANPRLLVQEISGLASRVERQQLVDVKQRETQDEDATLATWRQFLLPPLTTGDVELTDVLWDSLGSFEDVCVALREEAAKRAWRDSEVRAWMAALIPREGNQAPMPGRLPEVLGAAWARSAVDWAPDEGIRVSSAALLHAGDSALVRHRYWRGQLGVVLPELDSFRLKINRVLTELFGRKLLDYVPLDKEDPGAKSLSEPMDCEFTHLLSAIKNSPELARYGWVKGVIEEVRWARNELAHYRPITLEYFRYLCQRTADASDRFQ
jgi:hypothetical protein